MRASHAKRRAFRVKTIKETTCLFRDLSRSRVPLSLIKNAHIEEYKIVLDVDLFSQDQPTQYLLFYADEETARDDYRRILRLFKKMNGK